MLFANFFDLHSVQVPVSVFLGCYLLIYDTRCFLTSVEIITSFPFVLDEPVSFSRDCFKRGVFSVLLGYLAVLGFKMWYFSYVFFWLKISSLLAFVCLLKKVSVLLAITSLIIRWNDKTVLWFRMMNCVTFNSLIELWWGSFAEKYAPTPT